MLALKLKYILSYVAVFSCVWARFDALAAAAAVGALWILQPYAVRA